MKTILEKRKVESTYLPVSVWQVESGECYVQTLSPETAAKVSRWKGARLVAGSIAGGFLRVFSVPQCCDKLQRIADRLNKSDPLVNFIYYEKQP